MADYITQYFKEFDGQSAKFKKHHGDVDKLFACGCHAMLPKYDGNCGVAVGGYGMSSRTDENYTHSTEHIMAAVPEGMVYIGEVWHPEWECAKISGVYRRVPKTETQKEEAAKLLFMVFDVLTLDEWRDGSSTVPYSSRQLRLREQGPIHAAWENPFIPQQFGMKPTEAARFFKSNGRFDGVVLYDWWAGYYVGGTVNNGEVIKVKPTFEMDLLVVGATAQQRATKLGGFLTVRLGDGKTNDVGSGLDASTLREMFDTPDIFPGRIAKVEFMGYTEDGYLREPRFIEFRHDKKVADR